MRYNGGMRIGIDIRNIGRKRTGDEVVFLNLIRELAKFDADNEYYLFLDTRTEEEMRDITERLGVSWKKNFHFVALPARNKFDWNLWFVSRALREHLIDLYHTQYIIPFFVPRRTRVVTHIHDVSFVVFPKLIETIDRFFLKVLIPRSLRHADGIVVPSEFTKREVIRYFSVPEEKVSVVYNAVSLEFLEKRVVDCEAVRTKYGLPATFLLYVGTLQPRKNIPFLIEAFSRLHGEDSALKLVLSGNRSGHHIDGTIDETITRLKLGDAVVFSGFVDQADLPCVMSLARAFVYPSQYEGFGIPILESMSQGVPVLASDIPVLREVGKNAAMFASPSDVTAFSEALRTISFEENLRNRLIEKGIRRACFFSWEQSARDLLATYEKICFDKKTVR